MTRVQLRVRLMRDAHGRHDEEAHEAIQILKFTKEKGVLMALKRAGPGAEMARQAFFEVMNPKMSIDALPEAKGARLRREHRSAEVGLLGRTSCISAVSPERYPLGGAAGSSVRRSRRTTMDRADERGVHRGQPRLLPPAVAGREERDKKARAMRLLPAASALAARRDRRVWPLVSWRGVSWRERRREEPLRERRRRRHRRLYAHRPRALLQCERRQLQRGHRRGVRRRHRRPPVHDRVGRQPRRRRSRA